MSQRILLVFCLVVGIASCQPDLESTYVVPTVLNVRKGPSTKNPVIAQVRRGQELKVVARQAPWVNIQLSETSEGWVHGDYVGTPTDVRASLNQDLRKKQGSVSRPRVSRTTKKRKSTELTIDGLIENLPDEIPMENLPPLEGLARVMGSGEEGQVVVEFLGDEEKLERAMMMITVLDISDGELDRNAEYALGFIKNALPGLARNRDWMLTRLRSISSRDLGTGELQAKGRTVSFEFLKALGAVRVTVVKDA
jgi:uncharacterized protein YraI